MFKKIIPLCVLYLMLSACSNQDFSQNQVGSKSVINDNNSIYMEIELAKKEIHFDNNKFKFHRGLYSVCIDNKAYLVNAQSSTMFIPVMDNFEQISCVDKYKNKTVSILHGETSRGVFEVCIGGYEFIMLSESSSSSFVQQKMLSGGKAKMCIPDNKNKDSLENLVFLHPQVKRNIVKIQNILDEDSDENKIIEKKKIY